MNEDNNFFLLLFLWNETEKCSKKKINDNDKNKKRETNTQMGYLNFKEKYVFIFTKMFFLLFSTLRRKHLVHNHDSLCYWAHSLVNRKRKYWIRSDFLYFLLLRSHLRTLETHLYSIVCEVFFRLNKFMRFEYQYFSIKNHQFESRGVAFLLNKCYDFTVT